MSYSVNLSLFRSVFAVPSDIVDKHIRLANEHQLKVLLWILRNSPENPDIAQMCSALKMNQSDAVDYLQYWVLTGVLSGADNNNITVAPPQSEKIAEHTAEVKSVSTSEIKTSPSKPSSMEIVARLEESPEIGHLFNEAQVKLGRTIGYDGQCTLLLLHDHYGLPAEVIFMMIDYCVSIGKSNNGYLEAVGKDWGTREIDTLDKAAEQITVLRNSNLLWKQLASYAGITNPRPTMKQTELLRKWSCDYKFNTDMIMLAYEEMANHTTKFSMGYMDKVLANWHSKEFKKPEDVENEKSESKAADKSNTSKSKNNNQASYSLDKFNEQSLHAELKYERKKKG